MSNFNGRPNVTQYIANLNKIQQEPSMSAPQDPAGLEPDFAPFVGNDLFDFDMGELGDLNEPLGYDAVQEGRARRQNAAAHRQNAQQPDFLNTDMTFPDFSNTNFSGIPNAGPNIAQNNPYPMNIQSSTSPVSTFPGAQVGDKRKASDMTIQHPNPYSPVEEGSRHAAEEDKRRRNTAASARFRVKKKQREQAMEKTAKEMTEKVSLLEAKINQLEMENKWLKAMVLEKTGKKVEEELSGRWKEEKKSEMRESSTEKRNDGVGTKDEEDGEGEGEEN